MGVHRITRTCWLRAARVTQLTDAVVCPGKAETRTINLPKGTYRAVVQAKCGYTKGYSSPVTLTLTC